jgi:hypothetical protein
MELELIALRNFGKIINRANHAKLTHQYARKYEGRTHALWRADDRSDV